MKVYELIKELQRCNENWEVILSNYEGKNITWHRVNRLYSGNYNFAELDCGAPTFKISGLDIDGKDLNAVLIT
jgi:hypothetical protein